ncbi:hypothetical protein C0Q70_18483 [Pomacea canaliculata]|uniref:Katanin p80 WD40 repeat-containing subunit B1 n=1 Tax=Pomacea canaliculata TaxID=400727 RepID=A0A2T7NGN2_POMCA|nr:hypothetical protein C0Q70_18483 [Pomacea canaliculata]
MANPKRAWKLQEFTAHGADVKCVGLGHKSGRVMVTGGDDRKVNLWSVGKPHCIMSLTGHTTSIEAVRFGHAEEMVIAGSLSGALKVWDLEQAKILRTLTGHKAGIKSLDFHPYGDYAASGSMDCNVKLWDIRRKGCIYTYKSHTGCVNCLRFSPDGRWIASAGEDDVVKLWDLTAGKLLTDLKLHKGPVNVVEFHPHELLLASGSSDRTIKFWDLETFQLVSSTEGDSTGIRSIAFHPDGMCLYSGSHDMLKVYGWEPVHCFDAVSIGWSDVCDMSISNTQMIGASFYKTNVSSFVVNLESVRPLGGSQATNSNRRESSGLSNSRKIFVTERPPTQSTKQASEPKQSDEPAEKTEEGEDASAADIQNPAEYRELFQGNIRQACSVTLQGVGFFQKQPEQVTGTLSENEVLDFIANGHNAMMTVMSNRSRNLQIVRAMWTSGNLKTAIDSAISMNDPAVLVDVVNILNLKTSLWNLDLCTILLPKLKELMSSKYECYVVTAGQAIKLVIRNMGQTIKTNLTAPPGIGVDISREERNKKCSRCHTALMDIRSMIEKRRDAAGKLASLYKEILLLMSTLD